MAAGQRSETGVALVTGGAGGIGAAIVRRLRASGARVAICDLAPLTAAPEGPAWFRLDLADADAVAATVARIEAEVGPIDRLVNAAGILGRMSRPARLALADWDREMAVNLRGTYLMCREVGTRMAGRGRGAIVNVASVVGRVGGPLHGYAPAKAAVIALTRSLAAEWGRAGVRVNALSPGFTRTPALAAGLDRGVLSAERITAATCLGRLVEAEEVAAAAVWLLGEEASAVTGIDLPVDAGYLAGLSWLPFGGPRTP